MKHTIRIFLLGLLPLWTLMISAQNFGFIEAEVDNHTPYVGEQITYSFRFYDPGTVDNPRYEAPDFSGFGQQPGIQLPQSVEIVDGQQNTVTTIETRLIPNRSGTISIAPSQIVVPETPFRDGIVLQTQPIKISVQALPENAPETFRGAVGQFDLTVSLETPTVSQNMPATLIVAITGVNNLEPIISPQPQLSEEWRAYPKPPHYETANNLLNSKVFEWVFIPDEAGEQTIPAVIFSYFDPQTATYQTLGSEPLILEVLPTQDSSETNNLDTEILPARPLSLKTHVTSTVSYPSQSFWLLWLIPPGIVFIVWIMTKLARRQSRSRQPRPANALQRSYNRLKKAQASEPEVAYQHVQAALLIYFGSKLKHPPGEIDREMIEQSLTRFPGDLQQRVYTCLDQAEAGRYAPVTKLDARQLIKYTSETLAQLEKGWEK